MWATVVNLMPITTDLTIVGGAVILLVLLVVGFRLVRIMVDENRYTWWKKDDSGNWYFDNTGNSRHKGFWES